MKKHSVFWYAATILIMIMIFFFSSQNSTDSSHLSALFVHWLAYFHLSTYVVRKLAHMSEFGLLAISSSHAIHEYTYTLIFCFLYACSDEFHQLFVAGRAGSIIDVGFDTLGAFLFLTLYWVFFRKAE